MSPIRVLIADDHRLFRQGLRGICETMGRFEVVGEAANGQEAVNLARQLKPDVVLMDISMPEMNGEALAKEILKLSPNMPIILCSGYNSKVDEKSVVTIGIQSYLQKPYNMKSLADAVRQALTEKADH